MQASGQSVSAALGCKARSECTAHVRSKPHPSVLLRQHAAGARQDKADAEDAGRHHFAANKKKKAGGLQSGSIEQNIDDLMIITNLVTARYFQSLQIEMFHFRKNFKNPLTLLLQQGMQGTVLPRIVHTHPVWSASACRAVVSRTPSRRVSGREDS
jgi:hypothetical protein